MTKKSYYGDPAYMSLHSKMYILVSSFGETGPRTYDLYLVNSELPSDEVQSVNVSVTLTYDAAFAFRSYRMSPDTLINLFAYLCILSGKNIVNVQNQN